MLQLLPESSPLHLAARGGSLDCVRELLAWERIDCKEILLGSSRQHNRNEEQPNQAK
ncbi:hypothetical protein Scep_007621 [Stephania cephalantha]|uniref:Uncharacterized protein n=1 Tax=Stephania cephalantha TaxID=152367 RepID=A0AAP0KC74_9MAGN